MYFSGVWGRNARFRPRTAVRTCTIPRPLPKYGGRSLSRFAGRTIGFCRYSGTGAGRGVQVAPLTFVLWELSLSMFAQAGVY